MQNFVPKDRPQLRLLLFCVDIIIKVMEELNGILLNPKFHFITFVFILFVALVIFVYRMLDKKYESTENGENVNVNNNLSDLSQMILDSGKTQDYLYGCTNKYTWSQNETEIELLLPVSEEISKKNVKCNIKANKLTLVINENIQLDGDLYSEVIPEECNWQLGDIIYYSLSFY